MAGVTGSVRASVEEWVLWRGAAEGEGLSVNAWARRALNQCAELEAALRRQKERDDGEAD